MAKPRIKVTDDQVRLVNQFAANVYTLPEHILEGVRTLIEVELRERDNGTSLYTAVQENQEG